MDEQLFFTRTAQTEVLTNASFSPVVGIVGPRQIGKTSLALSLRNQLGGTSVYLDLEREADLNRIADIERFIEAYPTAVIVLDEIQRLPKLFPELRGIIDRDRRPGRFILLGSASPTLIRDASESLAGRIAYVELAGLTLREVQDRFNFQDHWFRGGFPRALLLPDDASSRWREQFIRTYIERDLPQLGLKAEPAFLRKMWTMLAHLHGQLLNREQLSRSLGIDRRTLDSYLSFFEHAYLIRLLPPFFRNAKKRLVKQSKLYIRDTGILHELLRLYSYEDLLAHPVIGASWEGYVLENLIASAPRWADFTFYRSHNGAEVDIIVERAGIPVIAVEVKAQSSPKATKGFYVTCADLQIERKFIIAQVAASYDWKDNIKVLSPTDMQEVFVDR